MRILVLDIGSSSVKASIYNARTRRCAPTTRIPFPTTFTGPRVEIAARRLLNCVLRAGRAALSDVRVDAVAFCTFSSGVVVTSPTGKPLTPIIVHSDRRSTQIAADLVRDTGKRWWLQRTANLPYPGGIGASTLAWLTRHEPGLFRGTYRAGQISSLVGHLLTGNWVTDPSQAVFLGLWDIRRNAWSADVCRHVGIRPDSLPHVQWADSILGGLSPRCARAWQLTPGTPVLGGFVDTSAGIIQSPLHPGQLTHNAGSTDVLAMTLDRPAPAEGILTRPVGVGRVYPPAWLAVRTIASSGSAVTWAREKLFPDLAPRAWQTMFKRALAMQDPGVTCDAAFAGQRAAIAQDAGATFRGIRLGTTRQQMLAAILRGLIRQSIENYELLRQIHRPRRDVYAMGGASALGDAMHRAWPDSHTFRALSGDSLRGLGELACRVLADTRHSMKT